MTWREKIYRATVENGFCSPVFPNASCADVVERLLSGSSLDPWTPPRLTWERHSAKDAFPDFSVFPVLNTCSNDAAQELWPQPTQDLRLLPFFVDDSRWNFMCPLLYTNAIDTSSSEIDWSEYVDQQKQRLRWVSAVRWVNILEPHISRMDVFKLAIQPRGWGYFTERFVGRYQALGLKGVRFEHMGYLIDKPENAVAPPPRPVPQVNQAPRWTKWKTAQEEEIDSCIQAGHAFLLARGLNEASEAGAILGALATEIEAHRPEFAKLKPKVKKTLLAGPAGAFGLLLRQRLQWNWVALQVTFRTWDLGLESPNGGHALCLNQVMVRQLTSPQPSTIQLLFNMIAEGQLPEGGAGDHIAIG